MCDIGYINLNLGKSIIMNLAEKNEPLVTIVIPVYNEEKYFSSCLDSIFKLDYPKNKLEIIVVDNGSTDSTLDIAKRYDVSIFILAEGKVGAVRNYGVVKALGGVVVFLDSDCVVFTDWLRKGISLLIHNDNSVVGGQYLLRAQPKWLERNWVLSSGKGAIHQRTLVGGCIMIYKHDFEAVGGFRESLNAGEDSDLTYRLEQRGKNIIISNTFNVVHLGYPTNVKEFIGRQVWHSSDYMLDVVMSLRDKVFLVTIFFILGHLFTIAGLVGGELTVSFWGLSLILLCVGVLSCKRILRAKYKATIKSLLNILAVDYLYLTGRAAGVFLGTWLRLKGQKKKKVDKR